MFRQIGTGVSARISWFVYISQKKLFFPWMRLELDFLFHFWPFPNYSCLTYSLLFPVFSFVPASAGSFVLENRKGNERCQSMIIMIMQPGLHDSKTMPQAFPTPLDPLLFLQWLRGDGVSGISPGRQTGTMASRGKRDKKIKIKQASSNSLDEACHWVNQKSEGASYT